MSVYTTLCVSVSPEVGLYFMRFMKEIREKPNKVSKDSDGTVTALWENRNHFDEYTSDSDYNVIIGFLMNLGDDKYYYESYTEQCEPVMYGDYVANFSTKMVFELYGEPVVLDSIMSENRKSRKFLNRRGRK